MNEWQNAEFALSAESVSEHNHSVPPIQVRLFSEGRKWQRKLHDQLQGWIGPESIVGQPSPVPEELFSPSCSPEQCQGRVPSHGVGFKSNQLSVDYSYKVYPGYISIPSRQVTNVDQTVCSWVVGIYLFPLVACRNCIHQG